MLSRIRRLLYDTCGVVFLLSVIHSMPDQDLYCAPLGAGAGSDAHHPRQGQDRVPGLAPAHGDGAGRAGGRRRDRQPGHGQVRDGGQQGERRGRHGDGRGAGEPDHVLLPVGGTACAAWVVAEGTCWPHSTPALSLERSCVDARQLRQCKIYALMCCVAYMPLPWRIRLGPRRCMVLAWPPTE